ncbi:DUF262 domain-containing protein [Myroides odoratimimus]|uniref:DUF262 domain-containing protein n=1 Tax=Myroides TaxID=76831 RepID=UPI00257911CF|nr:MULTISPECIES: DUF262 domain-containing HNH endonuclease family protein [Myroides]MDM1348951.1 DUF262 domain-containing protein [Myroides marinus]MDM1448327.1 DUF262 domain-containing protein [Myroides odoratimimus]MDM1451674.1 DUF262 domain-containing protein [Myroides odoratimimus]MDM1454972.1 DUF262 domain-containing protein [Myroides odoratimimus]MDM1468729.1 DUF262 domain-containing protein [Myroides odoratimimus]
MEAGKRTIRDIFNRGRNLEIPFFQRAYVWDTEQWQRFLEDMRMVSITKRPYFLGSVILKQQETASNKDSILTVIDGQQRLTTLNIFLKVLCLKNNSDTDFIETFKKQRDKSIILLHNHNDQDSFNKVVNLESLQVFKDVSENDNILAAYNFFNENIKDDDLLNSLDFFNILDNILFVGIDLGYEEDEQQIFDTINSLGVRLTTAELLKNYFFKRDEIENYEKYWKKIFEKDDETKIYWDREITTGRLKRTFIDLFFYSYLQIKIQESELRVKTDDKIDFSKVENLFESYKRFIRDYDLDKTKILDEIKEYAILFKDNFDYDIVNNELTAESGIERINAIIFGLDTSTLIPYTLYILKNVSDQNQRNELFAFIESYIMRRMVVKATTKNYNQLFTDRLISNEILSKEQFIKFLETRNDKVNYLPNDIELKQGFENSILINKQTAGIIYLIESKIRNKQKQATQLLGINRYSLEHLMPKKWENKWHRISTKEAKDYRNFKLKTLGNLAIITQSLNASIRDANWPTKKKGSGNKEGLSHYSGGIETLAPYLELDEWNESEIEKRADFLLSKAKEIWKAEEIEIASV